MEKEQNVRVDPAAALPGGEVAIECEGYDTSNLHECRAMFGGRAAHLVGVSPSRVLAIVPQELEGGETEVVLESADGRRSNPARVVVGRNLAEDLHIVANPAFDPDDGSLYVTLRLARPERAGLDFSGRGGRRAVRPQRRGRKPDGIAFDSLGQMFVTSRWTDRLPLHALS